MWMIVAQTFDGTQIAWPCETKAQAYDKANRAQALTGFYERIWACEIKGAWTEDTGWTKTEVNDDGDRNIPQSDDTAGHGIAP